MKSRVKTRKAGHERPRTRRRQPDGSGSGNGSGRGNGGGAAGGGPGLENAFQLAFLERLLDQDQPATALAAATAGPWEVAPAERGRFRVERSGEAGAGEEPAAVVDERQAALLLAAALPGSSGRELYRLRPERRREGYELLRAGRSLGFLAWFDPHLVGTLAALEHIVSSPRALALLLEAAGHDALWRAGRLLARAAERPPVG